MKRGTQTALGIDISKSGIRLALLRKGADGIELLRAGVAAVPDGAIKDGSIEDAEKLAEVLRQLQVRSKIPRTTRTAVSLFVNPTVMRIVDMPEQAPANIGRYIENEARRCVALSGRDAALDFCRVGSQRNGAKRLLMAATDGQKLAELIKTCGSSRLNVHAVEPALLACTRAFYDKRIAGKYDCNVLLALLQNGVLTLAVFRKQALDFVRTATLSEETDDPQQLCGWLAEQMNAIIRFYDVEVADSAKEWEVTLVTEHETLPGDRLHGLLGNVSLDVKTIENAWEDTTVAVSEDIGQQKPSLAAIGLAMGLLDADAGNLQINLLPPKSAEVRSVRKQLLVTANVMAAILLMMILASGGLGLLTRWVNERIDRKKQTDLSEATRSLLREQDRLDKQIKQLSDRPGRLNKMLASRKDVDWARILRDIGEQTPKTARITELRSGAENSKMHVEGVALSYGAVNLFEYMLNRSQVVNSASVRDAERDNDTDGLVRYSIDCLLTEVEKDS
jgi:Tfp pilus assembly protein PilN